MRIRLMLVSEKIYSHVTHTMMLGFKGLFVGITDGMSQMLPDFALVGEAGKKGNHGLKQKQLDTRFSKEHDKDSHTAERIREYDQSKITLMIEMISRIIKRKIHFDYVLADSWFACAEVILFITSRHVRCHYLGMIKMGKTKYMYKGKEYTANQLVALFDHPKKGRRYSRRLGCWYITVDVVFAGRNVRLFFCKRSNRLDLDIRTKTNCSQSLDETIEAKRKEVTKLEAKADEKLRDFYTIKERGNWQDPMFFAMSAYIYRIDKACSFASKPFRTTPILASAVVVASMVTSSGTTSHTPSSTT